MNKQTLQIWSKVIDNEKLLPSELEQLGNECRHDPQLISELQDDHAMNGLLDLFSESPEKTESFCRSIVERFQEVDSLPEISPIISEKSGLEDVTEIEIVTKRPTKKEERNTLEALPSRRAKAKWSNVVLAIATMLVLGLFVVVLRNSDWKPLVDAPPDSTEQTSESTLAADSTGQPSPDAGAPELVSDPKLPLNEAIVEKGSSSDLPQTNRNMQSIVFAQVFAGEDVEWESPLLSNQIGQGNYSLSKGDAVIKLDNGTHLVLFSPAEIRLNSVDDVELIAGRVLLDSTGTTSGESFIKTRDAAVSRLDNSKIFCIVDDEGTNMSLLEGDISVALAASDQKIDLIEDQLENAFVKNSSSVDEPGVLIAHGVGDKYFAQIGVGESATQSTSPNEFDKLIQGMSSGSPGQNISEQLQSRIFDFNKSMREMHQQWSQGNRQRWNQNFDLPNFFNPNENGVPFSSPRDLGRLRQELEKNFGFGRRPRR